MGKQGFKGGTRGATEWNRIDRIRKTGNCPDYPAVLESNGSSWELIIKHLSVLAFEKQERAKEVAELEQVIRDSKEELNHILDQQAVVGQETEQIRQEVSELSEASNLLKEQLQDVLAEDKEKLLFDHGKAGEATDKIWKQRL